MSKKRTRGMTTVAVLNFVFGGVGIIGGLWVILACHALMSQSLFVGEASSLSLFLFVGGLFSVAYGGAAIAGGVGVLRLLPWGRTFSLIYAWTFIATSIIISLFAPSGQGGGKASSSEFVARLIGFVLGLIYPVTLICLFRKPSWTDVFLTVSPLEGKGRKGYKFCTQCGSNNDTESAFCTECGNKF